MILLDTHAWLWWTGDPGSLSKIARERIRGEREIAISAISCWEVGMLIEHGRLRLNPDARGGIRVALAVANLRVIPVDETIATEAGLIDSRFHGDPADRLIVATALVLRTPLVTKDARIRSAKLVTALW